MEQNKLQNTPIILTDKSRLQEIYNLRVLSYEHSHKAEFVNRQIFPNGWKDDLDELEKNNSLVCRGQRKNSRCGTTCNP
jgi:hypothetical protein